MYKVEAERLAQHCAHHMSWRPHPCRRVVVFAGIGFDEGNQITERLRWQDRLVRLGFDPVGSTPEEFRKQIEIELVKWAKVIWAANVKAP